MISRPYPVGSEELPRLSRRMRGININLKTVGAEFKSAQYLRDDLKPSPTEINKFHLSSHYNPQ